MKKTLFLSALVVVSLQVNNASASLLAGWDFAGLVASPSTPANIPATISLLGPASIDVSAFASPASNPERTAFGGSTLNTFAGGDTLAGQALALANNSANGKSLIFSFSTSGYEDLILSFATRGTATGFSIHDWSWSTDGINYTSIVGNTAVTATAFEIKTLDLSAITGLDNAATAYLKLTVSGATSATGNNRFDNIQFNATAVPEPSAMAIVGGFGLLGLFMAARRRS